MAPVRQTRAFCGSVEPGNDPDSHIGACPCRRIGRHFAGTCAGRDGGFIIIAVLWILLALATLASIYAAYVVRTAYAVGPSDDRVNAEALFTAALELTAYRLTAAQTAQPAATAAPAPQPAQPDAQAAQKAKRPSNGRFNFRLGRATIVGEFHSESGRIDLNEAPKPLLANLFAMFGARPDDAEQYADRIIAWRSAAPQNGQPDAEGDAYRMAGRNYAPRGAPFQEVGELWLVLGLPPGWVERVMPYITVYSGVPQANIFDASPFVLAALPGVSRQQVNAVLAARDLPDADGRTLLALLGDAQGNATAEPGNAVRVTVTIQFDGGMRTSADIVILLGDDANEPYRVLSWRDDFDQLAPAGG
jgi:general secretion pathway protein K